MKWKRKMRRYENDRYMIISVVYGWKLVDKATKVQHDTYASPIMGMRAAERMEAEWTTRNP